MGSIVKFPIFVLNDKATEEQFGIAGKLRDNVRPTDQASREELVSENGIVSAIIEYANARTCAKNKDFITPFIPIFDSITNISGSSTGSLTGVIPISGGGVSGECGNVLKYNSITGIGTVNVTSDFNTIYIDVDAGDASGKVIGLSRTLNGGIEQEATKINFSDFDSITGASLSSTSGTINALPVFKNIKYGDVVGKILIKNVEYFDDQTTRFSIGVKGNKTFYTTIFDTTSGTTNGSPQAGDLVDFHYGIGMYDKVEYMNTPITDGDNDIYLYKYDGLNNTQGELQCVIFYDKLNLKTTYVGYILGTFINSQNYHSQRFVLSTETLNSIADPSYSERIGFVDLAYNEYVYVFTGSSKLSVTNPGIWYDDVYKYDTVTSSDSFKYNLVYKRFYAIGKTIEHNAFIFGCQQHNSAGAMQKWVEQYNYINNVSSVVTDLLLGIAQTLSTGAYEKHVYILGGDENRSGDTSSKKIQKYKTETNTPEILAAELGDNKEGASSSENDVYIFVNSGGEEGGGTWHRRNTFDKFNKLTETSVSFENNKFPIAMAWNSTIFNKTAQYLLWGDNSDTNIIKMPFATETAAVMTTQAINKNLTVIGSTVLT
jgi:hypothetical protein